MLTVSHTWYFTLWLYSARFAPGTSPMAESPHESSLGLGIPNTQFPKELASNAVFIFYQKNLPTFLFQSSIPVKRFLAVRSSMGSFIMNLPLFPSLIPVLFSGHSLRYFAFLEAPFYRLSSEIPHPPSPHPRRNGCTGY